MKWKIYHSRLANSGALNEEIIRQFSACYGAGQFDGSHWFGGHYENIYIEESCIPAVTVVLEHAVKYVHDLFGVDTKIGRNFWFNLAKTGQATGEHDHVPNGMNINYCSGVYYLKTPVGCGSIVFEGGQEIAPQAGELLLFPSNMKHHVKINSSLQDRLSLAFNLELPDG